MQIGSNVSNSTDSHSVLKLTVYARQLAERREQQEVQQLANFGITVGWVFALFGGFCWFCVVSRLDWAWLSMLVIGLGLISLGTVVPQSLYLPHRVWMAVAHLQGRIMMSLLLSVVYFTLFWPLGRWEYHRSKGRNPFFDWNSKPQFSTGNWHTLPTTSTRHPSGNVKTNQRRSMINLFLDCLAFFAERGHFLLLPILLLLLVLGLVLFFVQTSAIAPFIYTL